MHRLTFALAPLFAEEFMSALELDFSSLLAPQNSHLIIATDTNARSMNRKSVRVLMEMIFCSRFPLRSEFYSSRESMLEIAIESMVISSDVDPSRS